MNRSAISGSGTRPPHRRDGSPLRPTHEQTTRDLTLALLAVVAVSAVASQPFNSNPGDDTKRALPPKTPVTQVVDYSSPEALGKGRQTTLTVEPGDGAESLARKRFPHLDTTSTLRDTAVTYMQLQEPQEGFHPGYQVKVPANILPEAVQSNRPPAPASPR